MDCCNDRIGSQINEASKRTISQVNEASKRAISRVNEASKCTISQPDLSGFPRGQIGQPFTAGQTGGE
ncbi:MAG TPA: hypothetical protein VJX74_13455 [Blastocatellia bacterium]|nr:hypothetical protein [Blastocatellia bacterium]